jgi:hypothetical protein
MPMFAHVFSNLTFWTVITAVATAALWLAHSAIPSADYLGDLTAIAGMFFGTMVMLKSQSGFVPAEQIETEA